MSNRQGIQEPAENQSCGDEPAEEPGAEAQLLTGIVAHQRRERDGDEQREQEEQAEMSGHLRPWATSYASSTTSVFNSPATITNALPYS